MAAPPAAFALLKILVIVREEVKVGETAAHRKVEAGWPKAFAQVKWPTYSLAVTSMTGLAEAWYMTGHPSYAAYETARQNLEKAGPPDTFAFGSPNQSRITLISVRGVAGSANRKRSTALASAGGQARCGLDRLHIPMEPLLPLEHAALA